MRASFWIGLVLVVVGLIVALSHPTYNDEKADIGVGGAEVSIQEREGIPPWVGWTGAGVGLVLMVIGLSGRGESRGTFDRRPHAPPQ